MQFLLYCFDFIFYPELIEEERIREDESYKQVLKNTKILLLLYFDKAVGFRKTLILFSKLEISFLSCPVPVSCIKMDIC